MSEVRAQLIAVLDGIDLSDSRPVFRQIDSLQLLTLIMRLEKAFHVNVSPFEFTEENFATLESIENLIQNKIAQKASPER